VAILLVLSYHCFTHPSGGFYGVDLFFVLSGFLITSLLLDERARTGGIDLRAFYIRRARRLLPALFAFLVVVAPFLAARPSTLVRDLAAVLLYATNIVRAGDSHGLPLIGHLWSLAEEEQFYVVWPALMLLVLRRWPRRFVPFLGATLIALVGYRTGLLLSGASHQRLYFAPDTHADPLIVGCLLAALARTRRLVVPGWVAIAATATLGLLAVVSTPYAAWSLALGLPAVSLASAVIIAAAANTGSLLARLLTCRPLVWLGLISYSLYIWQQLVFKFSGENGVIAFPFAICVAWLSYRYVETRFRRPRVGGRVENVAAGEAVPASAA
jgi:peptidoglycan/LPS O-acetylase OafA/YrhL